MDIDAYRLAQPTSVKHKNIKQYNAQSQFHNQNSSKNNKNRNEFNHDLIAEKVDNAYHEDQEEHKQLKNQNLKLKRMLKQAQAKRIQITKQCSELANKYQKLEQENMSLHRKVKDVKQVGEGQKFRYQEIKFLNKELSAEIQQIRKQNQLLLEKLRHQSQILQKKYEQLEERTYKRIEQALRRIKKSIHYLSSLSPKQIEKTKNIQLQNLNKAAELLKGKYIQNSKYEEQIEQLMNPIRNIQQDLHQRSKELGILKEQNLRLINEVKKHKKIQKQLLPQYKEAMEKLKKSLAQVRLQLTENQYEKCQIKKKYGEKIKQMQIKYQQLFKQNRKMKLQNKIYEKKIQEIEEDVEEEKQRLMGENQLLKKLCRSDDNLQANKNIQSDLEYEDDLQEHDYARQNQTDALSYKTTANFNRNATIGYVQVDKNEQPELQPEFKDQRVTKMGSYLKKNYSASHLQNFHGNQMKKQTLEIQRNRQKISRPRQKSNNVDVQKEDIEEKGNLISRSRQSDRKRKSYNHLRHNNQSENRRSKQKSNRPTRREGEQKLELSEYEQNEVRNNLRLQNKKEIYSEENYEYEYKEQRSSSSITSVSQEGLKSQIYKIDQQIIEIQKTLDRELNLYK